MESDEFSASIVNICLTLQFLPFIHFLNKHLSLRLLFHEMKPEYSLGPVEGDDGFFVQGLSCGLDLVYKVGQDLAGEISASPVKCEFTALFGGLESTFVLISGQISARTPST